MEQYTDKLYSWQPYVVNPITYALVFYRCYWQKGYSILECPDAVLITALCIFFYVA